MMFTVVTPSFNCGPYILENFQSVWDQGCSPAELEHWVIDGGSKDGTVDLLKAQPDIQWISEPDKGLSDAVNKGIQRAQGEWIIWLNADDLLAPNAIPIFKQHAAKHPDCRVFTGDVCFIRPDHSIEQRVAGWDYNLKELLGCRTGINQPSTFIHREVYKKAGLLDVENKYTMDYEWMVRAMHHYQCVPIPEILAFSRRRAGSITHLNTAGQFWDFYRIRRQHRCSRLSKAELRIWFYLATEPLRRVRWIRSLVRSTKRLVGQEPLHPM